MESIINAKYGVRPVDPVQSSDQDSIKLDEVSIHDVDSIKSDLERADDRAIQFRRETSLSIKPKLTF
jgi:hypothetical protein